MTSANPGRQDGNAGDQTIPLIPDTGFAQPVLQPLPEETRVDPVRPADPWSSGPGLGESTSSDATVPLPTTPAPTAPLPTTPLPTAPLPTLPPDGPAAAVGRPGPASTGYGSPADYATRPPAPGWNPAPAPAPQPASGYVQPPYADAYPEPDGPAAGIPNQTFPTYAASGYAGQAWPAVVDPVAYDYGYSRTTSSPHPNAVTSMVLGILGLTVFAPLAPFAWYLAARGRREMAGEPGRWTPSAMLTAGLVLGIIGTTLLAFGLLFVLVVIMAVITSSI